MLWAALTLWVGSNEVATLDGSRQVTVRAVDDGVLTRAEYDAVRPEEAERESGGDDGEDEDGDRLTICDVAEDRYRVVVGEERLSVDSPAEVEVREIPATAGGHRSCTVFEERRSAEAGISVLVTAALGGVAMLLLWEASAMSLRSKEVTQAHRGWAPALGLLATVAGATYVLSGVYRHELQLWLALAPLLVVVVLMGRHLLVLGSSASPIAEAEAVVRLESVRARKGEAREALLVLSILFSLGVALIAALNARYLATRGQGFLNLETDPLELGGFSSGDLQVVTTLESLLFAAILVGVAGPALLHIEKQGGELLDDLCSDESSVSEPATEDGDLAPQAVDALITRDESGAKLGLTTRPVQWMESTFALVLPILTGISADFLGLLG